MVLFNYSTKELTAKVVYYGPGLCGKTTNLQWIHEKLPIKNKGKMLSLATETDRTLFFDFLPIEIGTIRGMKTRIQLYTVPGQVFYNATRRMVLKGADAVCFVCDSQEAMLDANLESYENMRQNLEANEIDPDEIPAVLQYNKRDLPNALPIEILNERMNPHNYPFYEAIAVKGAGVEDTLKAVTKLVFKSLSAKYGDGAAAAAPGRAPGPPRTPQPQPFTPGPPLAMPSEDPLGELDVSQQEPPAPEMGTDLPPIEFDDESTPVGSVFPDGSQPPLPRVTPAPPSRPPLPSPPTRAPVPPRAPGQQSRAPVPQSRPPFQPTRPPIPPSRPPIEPSRPPIEPSRPPVAARRPHTTLVSRQDEAEELRRRIASPGLSEDVEMDLEEIEDFDRPTQASFVPGSPLTDTTAPEPVLQPERAGSTEVEVPIDIELAPGTTRLSLNIKLQLNLRRR
jgi:signal recognition particle receptor subunit beta